MKSTTDWDALGKRIIDLAEWMVGTPSIVDSAGEATLAEKLAGYLREQSEGSAGVDVRLIDVPKPTPCSAVMAYLPAPVATDRTFVLMGHFDTVGLEPYGPMAEHAFSSSALKQAFIQQIPGGEVAADIAAAAQSDEWAFGRGWLDMKGGAATIIEIFLHEARQRQLPAHLVLLLTPDEESASRGVRTLIPELTKLKQEHGLEFVRIINADYTAPLYPGDTQRYLYSGTVGKLLLGLSIFGHTTHVGETFNGVNSSALAGYLASSLEHDRKLLQGTGGEWLPPPTVLHMGDRRERYDVMTLDYAEVYVNMFHVGGDPKQLWADILSELRRLVKRYDREMRLRYNRFVARANLELPRYPLRPEVIDFAGLLQRVAKHTQTDVTELQQQLLSDMRATAADDRECALGILRKLHALLPPGRPAVIASLLPPFYPAQVAAKDSVATRALSELCSRNGLKHRRVYPYIADMSYFAFGGDSLEAWQRVSPLWFAPGEVERYQAVSAPVMNLGPWGLGAHGSGERVYLPYLRNQLPRLIYDTMYSLIQD